MPDRKRISLHADEFDALNADRGALPWTEYLRELREDNDPPTVALSDEDKREITQSVADEIEARLGRR